MQISRKDITNAILSSAHRVLEEIPEEERGIREFQDTSDLFGGSSPFDSLNLVAFVVDLEQVLEKRVGTKVALADERAMSQPQNPFSTVTSLADYVSLLLTEK
jgi:acyl carrier protein